MKALIVNGSPRKNGNTACAMAEIGRALFVRYDVEIVNAVDFKSRGCVNCDGCKRNGGRCVQPDDGAVFMDKILAADLIVFGSPVYWWGVSAQLKLLLDKFYSCVEKLQKAGKSFGVVAVGAENTSDPEYRIISEQFKCICAYLKWQLVLDESVSAAGIGDLVRDSARLSELAAAAGKL